MPGPVSELDRFGQEEAWWLGTALVEHCRSERLAVTILILLGEQRVFHAALPGTSVDNDGWAERKARVVAHFGMSSLEVFERHVKDNPEFFRLFALSADDYAPYGGAIPIKVRGTMGASWPSPDWNPRKIMRSPSAPCMTRRASKPRAAGSPPTGPQGKRSRRQETALTSRSLRPGQRAQVWIGGPQLAEPELLYETDQRPDRGPQLVARRRGLFLNGAGGLWRLALSESPDAGPDRVDLGGLPDLNNDHVLDPDGEHVYLSAMDTHIYRAPLAGGAAERVTPEDGMWHFLHGVSPDGSASPTSRSATWPSPGSSPSWNPTGSVRILDVGEGHLDGPEWSPDGQWIYLNTETFTTDPGARPARPHPRRRRTGRAAADQRHRGLVPPPLARRTAGHLHQLPRRHPRPPRRPRRRGPDGLHRRLDHPAPALPLVRRPGNPQRQQLGARQQPFAFVAYPGPATRARQRRRPAIRGGAGRRCPCGRSWPLRRRRRRAREGHRARLGARRRSAGRGRRR